MIPKVLSLKITKIKRFFTPQSNDNRIIQGHKSSKRNTFIIRASVDALCRDGAGQIARGRVKNGLLTRP